MLQALIPYSAGSLLAGLIANQIGKKFGRGALLGETPKNSYSAGLSWSPVQYIAIGAASWFAPSVLSSIMPQAKANLVSGGMFAMMVQKLVFTEIIRELPGESSQWFGGAEQVAYDEHGQAWMRDGGSWQAMQGAVVEATPLDGAVVEATPLDGPGYLQNYANREYNVADAYKRAYQQGGYY